MLRVRRRRRGEPVPEHVVPFRWALLPKALLLLVLVLVLGSATVLAAALLASRAGAPE
ncbi:hypothetical protein AB0D47_00940 [Streptomyces sp. NPDC048376]|uniref:hypothetical protein n=1 Tax=unclassified Streptomyces TaxID=2593676 RepID=UPI0034225EDE